MLNSLNFEVVGFSHTYRGGGGDYAEISISACLKSTLKAGMVARSAGPVVDRKDGVSAAG